MNVPPLVCDTTGTFKRKVDKANKGKGTKATAAARAKGGTTLIEGFDCIRQQKQQEWVQNLKRSHTTTHFTAETALVSVLHHAWAVWCLLGESFLLPSNVQIVFVLTFVLCNFDV